MVRGANSGLFQSHPAIGMRENNSSRAHGFSLSLFEFQLQAECFALGSYRYEIRVNSSVETYNLNYFSRFKNWIVMF
uniref:Uncharacterized protein n=1 Tax=Cucumis melo TaxID=3656 RepID=A0A9I9E5C2_CUCME